MKTGFLLEHGFNEIDTFVVLNMVARALTDGTQPWLISRHSKVTSMNGVTVHAHRDLDALSECDLVVIGSGVHTAELCADRSWLSSLSLDPDRQLIAAQCSGVQVLAALGHWDVRLPLATDAVSAPVLRDAGYSVADLPFYADGHVATAGGCMASPCVGAWAIRQLWGEAAAQRVLEHIAPVGQRGQYSKRIFAMLAGSEQVAV